MPRLNFDQLVAAHLGDEQQLWERRATELVQSRESSPDDARLLADAVKALFDAHIERGAIGAAEAVAPTFEVLRVPSASVREVASGPAVAS